MPYFFDSSALLKLYVEERGSAQVEEIVDSQPVGALSISRLASLELNSALVRRRRAGDYSDEALTAALALFEEDVERRFRIIELGGATMLRAITLVHRHALRAADAIQLACGLMARAEKVADGDLILVSSDRELNEAARAEKMDVLDPTLSS